MAQVLANLHLHCNSTLQDVQFSRHLGSPFLRDWNIPLDWKEGEEVNAAKATTTGIPHEGRFVCRYRGHTESVLTIPDSRKIEHQHMKRFLWAIPRGNEDDHHISMTPVEVQTLTAVGTVKNRVSAYDWDDLFLFPH